MSYLLNTVILHKGLEHPRILVSGGPGTNPQQIPKVDCILRINSQGARPSRTEYGTASGRITDTGLPTNDSRLNALALFGRTIYYIN